jgi:hypothetical protein
VSADADVADARPSSAAISVALTPFVHMVCS